MLDLFLRERGALRLSPALPLLGLAGLLVFLRLFCFACYALLGVPHSSSGACAGLPLYGLLGLCALLLLTPRLIEFLRPLPAVDLDAGPRKDALELSPLRRAWLRETRWLLLCVRESSEQATMQHLWELLASARQLSQDDRLELQRAGAWPRVRALQGVLRRNSERLDRRARRRLRATLEEELRALERALLRSASADPYR